MVGYFEGERVSGPLTQQFRGKSALVTETQTWKIVKSVNGNCGAQFTEGAEYTTSISSAVTAGIESKIGAILGSKDVVSVAAEVITKYQLQVTWGKSVKHTTSVPVNAPQCGRVEIRVYQRVCHYDIQFPNWFFSMIPGKRLEFDVETPDITVWPNAVAFDPRCNCDPPEKPIDNPGWWDVVLGRVQVIIRPQLSKNGRVTIDLWGSKVPLPGPEGGSVEVKSNKLPGFLVGLAGVAADEKVTVRASPRRSDGEEGKWAEEAPAGPLFRTIPGYQRLLAGAQNRPSSRVRHPLLVWHLGLWHRPQESQEARVESAAVETVEELFATYVRDITGRVRVRDPSTSISLFEPCLTAYEKDSRADNHPGLVVVEFDWFFFKATVRFEQHTEYCTISTLLDLSSEDGRRAYREANIPTKLSAIIDELDALEAMRDIDDDTRYGTNFRDHFSGISEAAFLTVWDEFYRGVLFTDQRQIDTLGEVFADFRGIVLSDGKSSQDGTPGTTDEAVEAIDEIPPRAQTEPAAEENPSNAWLNIQNAFWRKDKTRRRLVSKPPEGPDLYWKARYDLLWPLMTAKMGDVDFLNYEFTASLMSEGRALYLSALGAQPVKREPHEDRIPLCYGLYTHQLGGWAIGRLIEQINQQGTLRLASLIDVSSLQSASSSLRDAEETVRTALTRVTAEEDIAIRRWFQRPFDKSTARYSDKQIGALKASLEKAQESLAEADAHVPGGVAHRVERSRYYIRRFSQGLPGLQIRQFGDMQPYDVFVDRRLGPTFGYIDMLWSRHERVRRDMRALYQRVLAEETRNVATAIRDRNTETEAIQKVADFALFAVIAPYYIGTVVAYVAFPDHPHGMPNGYWLALSVLLVGVAVARWFMSKPIVLAVLALTLAAEITLGWIMVGQRSANIKLEIGWPQLFGTTFRNERAVDHAPKHSGEVRAVSGPRPAAGTVTTQEKAGQISETKDSPNALSRDPQPPQTTSSRQ